MATTDQRALGAVGGMTASEVSLSTFMRNDEGELRALDRAAEENVRFWVDEQVRKYYVGIK